MKYCKILFVANELGLYDMSGNVGEWAVKEYPDPKNEISYAYAITRTEWEKEKGLNNDQE